jgi:UPF0755 protein
MLKLIKYLFLLTILATLGALGAGVWLHQFAHSPLRLASDPLEFTIAQGSSLRSATRQIVRAGVDVPDWAFEAVARVVAKPTDIKAGTYELRTGATPLDLLGKLVRGEFAVADVKLIEGWTFRQVRAALDAHPRIRHETAGLSDADVLRRLDVPIVHPEGWFFPDTYVFPRGASDVEILRQAYRAMEKRLNAAWAQREQQVPLSSPYDALILASIVEKETGRADDRAMVAAVLTNRLRIGMRLQADPTVIYGLGTGFDGNLRKRDLLADTPYNTYTREGLPPTPIAMPGLASIEATLRPAQSEALYFVARGDGTSEFSRTLEDHNRAVTKYQRGGRP